MARRLTVEKVYHAALLRAVEKAAAGGKWLAGARAVFGLTPISRAASRLPHSRSEPLRKLTPT